MFVSSTDLDVTELQYITYFHQFLNHMDIFFFYVLQIAIPLQKDGCNLKWLSPPGSMQADF